MRRSEFGTKMGRQINNFGSYLSFKLYVSRNNPKIPRRLEVELFYRGVQSDIAFYDLRNWAK
jgi:hypothetical protein